MKSLAEMTKQLAKLGKQNFNIIKGYSLECINFIHSRYKFKSVDQALQIMCKDPETGIYPHIFCPYKKIIEEEDEEPDLYKEEEYGKNDTTTFVSSAKMSQKHIITPMQISLPAN